MFSAGTKTLSIDSIGSERFRLVPLLDQVDNTLTSVYISRLVDASDVLLESTDGSHVDLRGHFGVNDRVDFWDVDAVT